MRPTARVEASPLLNGMVVSPETPPDLVLSRTTTVSLVPSVAPGWNPTYRLEESDLAYRAPFPRIPLNPVPAPANEYVLEGPYSPIPNTPSMAGDPKVESVRVAAGGSMPITDSSSI